MRRLLALIITLATAIGLAVGCNTQATGTIPARCAAIDIDESELVVTDAAYPFDGVMRSIGALGFFDGQFELVAIVNRIDLATVGNGRPGELRLVYGLIEDGERQPFSLIVELAYPDTRDNGEWARLWHRRDALAAIIDEVLVSPRGQIRTHDARTATPQMEELTLAGGRPPRPARLFNTPPHDADNGALSEFVSNNEAAVLEGRAVVPEAMLASRITVTTPAFDLSRVDAVTRDAFERLTCNGCHTKEPTIDGTFHVSPRRRGRDALSGFLRREGGELERRADVLRKLLCL